MDEQPKSKPSLWRRWRQQTWKRRFAIYCGSFVLLIALFYVVENSRGTMALNAAKKRAADAGIELDFSKLMTREMPPDEENFAVATKNTFERFSNTKSVTPELEDWEFHESWIDDGVEERGLSYCDPVNLHRLIDKSLKLTPELAAEAVSKMLTHWDGDFSTLTNASKLPSVYYDWDWQDPDANFSGTDMLNVANALKIHAITALRRSDPQTATEDIETMLRIVSLHHSQYRHAFGMEFSLIFVVQLATETIWEGLNVGSFSMANLERIQASLNQINIQLSWDEMLKYQMAHQVLHHCGLADSPTRRSKTEKFMYFEFVDSSEWDLPDYFPSSLDEKINAAIAFMIPNGWFRHNLADSITSRVNMLENDLPMRERFHSEIFFIAGQKTPFRFVWGFPFEGDDTATRSLLSNVIGTETKLRQAKVAIAFELHRLNHGGYPEDFGALVPNYLDGIPIDPWTDNPMLLNFRPDGRPAIYSVGEDLDNDGGIPYALGRPPRDGDSIWHYSLKPGFDAKAHYFKNLPYYLTR